MWLWSFFLTVVFVMGSLRFYRDVSIGQRSHLSSCLDKLPQSILHLAELWKWYRSSRLINVWVPCNFYCFVQTYNQFTCASRISKITVGWRLILVEYCCVPFSRKIKLLSFFHFWPNDTHFALISTGLMDSLATVWITFANYSITYTFRKHL